MSAEVQSLRRTKDERRVEQAILDIDRAVSVLVAMYEAKPEAFQGVMLETNGGEPVVAYSAVAFLESDLKRLRENMERDYRAKLNRLHER